MPPVERSRTPERLPVVLSREEVDAILAHLVGMAHLFVVLLFGSGLRLEECLNLRVKDIDLDRHQIMARQGKGQKDRATMLPASARESLPGTLRTCAGCMHATWRGASVASSCRLRWSASSPMRRPNGGGSSCFQRPGSAEIPDSGHRHGTTCMNP